MRKYSFKDVESGIALLKWVHLLSRKQKKTLSLNFLEQGKLRRQEEKGFIHEKLIDLNLPIRFFFPRLTEYQEA